MPAPDPAAAAPSEAAALASVLNIPRGNSVTVRGSEVTSEELSIDQISEIMLKIDVLAARGVRVLPADSDERAGISYTQLALRGGKEVRDILAIATNQTPAFIGSLNVLEFAKVAGLVWRVQKDFFVQNQTEILQAFGLDETVIEELKGLVSSLKSLATSSPAVSQTSEALPSDKSAPSVQP